MAKIGLIAGSYKPYHAGHDGLVRLAAKECDEVHLYVSLSDRKRPGEVPILGRDMEKIWKTYIEPTMPANVIVTYGGSPVGNVWKDVGDASEAGSQDTYVIYADPTDIAVNFPDELRAKYASRMEKAGQIELRPVKRSETVNVSGTKMRQYLETGDKKSFIRNLPARIDGPAVWDILYATANSEPKKKPTTKRKKATKVETLLRAYIKMLLG